MRPLRKIVDRKVEYVKRDGYTYPRCYEVLECGHKIKVRQDFYGETNANNRRCKECEKLAMLETVGGAG